MLAQDDADQVMKGVAGELSFSANEPTLNAVE
jgi:hypothetical protein